jgi:hypothetical protein
LVKPLPSQDTGPILELPPTLRRDVLAWGKIILTALGIFIAAGIFNFIRGTYWAQRSNGAFWVVFFGASAVFVLMWMALFAAASSGGSSYLRALLPVRGRWARYWVTTVLWLLALMAVASIVMMPVA